MRRLFDKRTKDPRVADVFALGISIFRLALDGEWEVGFVWVCVGICPRSHPVPFPTQSSPYEADRALARRLLVFASHLADPDASLRPTPERALEMLAALQREQLTPKETVRYGSDAFKLVVRYGNQQRPLRIDPEARRRRIRLV